MGGRAGLLELSAGSVLRLDGAEWTVAAVEAQLGRVLLDSGGGDERWRSIRWLAHHRDCQAVPAAAGEAAPAVPRQPVTLDDLTTTSGRWCGCGSRTCWRPRPGSAAGIRCGLAPGSPGPAYDPRSTTLGQRRRAKVAELRALGADEAALLGLGQVSERTLKRMAAAWQGQRAGRVHRRAVGAGRRRAPSITEEVREAIFAVRAESLHRSQDEHAGLARPGRTSTSRRSSGRRSRSRLTGRCGRSGWSGSGRAGPASATSGPRRPSSRRRCTSWCTGPARSSRWTPRRCRSRSATAMFGEPVSVHLTLALDLFTHSVVAFRLTLVSDTAVDVAMLLRDVMMPLPMREGWGPEMEWPYPGSARRTSSRSSPATGSPGCRSSRPRPSPRTTAVPIKPRPRRGAEGAGLQHPAGQDAAAAGQGRLRAGVRGAAEPAVRAAARLYRSRRRRPRRRPRGRRGADHGADGAADRRAGSSGSGRTARSGEHAPAWGPGEEHSPNTLFAAAMDQGGFALQVPGRSFTTSCCPAHYVKIHAGRGVKIGGLWYGGPAPSCGACTGPSGRGGKHKGKWVDPRRPPRPAARCSSRTPRTRRSGTSCGGTGCRPRARSPPSPTRPPRSCCARPARRACRPRSDADLLPVLLKLLGGVAPVPASGPPRWARRRRRPGPARPPRATRRPATGTAPRPLPAGGRRRTARERGSPALAGAGGPGQRRGRRRAPAPAGAGGPAAARPARRRWETGCGATSMLSIPERGRVDGREPRGGGPGAGAGSPASFLPGPVPDRETWEGWTRWRLTRRELHPRPGGHRRPSTRR